MPLSRSRPPRSVPPEPEPPPAPAAATGGGGASEDRVYRALCKALFDGQLRPGTPLRERTLAEVFGATRGAVRKVLLRLGAEGKLQMFPNRGAFVPEPSREDIRQVYEARKAVEAGLVALLASRIGDAELARLRAHLADERHALRHGRRDESIRLAGAFHTALVQALANPELAAIVQRLVSRTQMFVALFEPACDAGCAPDEHQLVFDALASRDPPRAAAAMLDHLQRVEDRVTRHLDRPAPPDLGAILRAALSPAEDTP